MILFTKIIAIYQWLLMFFSSCTKSNSSKSTIIVLSCLPVSLLSNFSCTPFLFSGLEWLTFSHFSYMKFFFVCFFICFLALLLNHMLAGYWMLGYQLLFFLSTAITSPYHILTLISLPNISNYPIIVLLKVMLFFSL